MKVNILTKGFVSPTSRGWLHPIVKNLDLLNEMGVDINFYFKNSEEVKFCDLVIVETGLFISWRSNKSKIFQLLTDLKTVNNKCFI